MSTAGSIGMLQSMVSLGSNYAIFAPYSGKSTSSKDQYTEQKRNTAPTKRFKLQTSKSRKLTIKSLGYVQSQPSELIANPNSKSVTLIHPQLSDPTLITNQLNQV